VTFNGREYAQYSGQWYVVSASDTFAVNGTVIWVYFSGEATENDIEDLNEELDGEIIDVNCLGTYIIHSIADPEPDPLDFMESYLESEIVESGFNSTSWHFCWPDDPAVNPDCDYTQRYLYRPVGDEFDNTINMGPVWEPGQEIQGSPDVKVGVLDSGLLFQHGELVGNVWQNVNTADPNDDEDADNDGHTIEFIGGEWVLDPGDLNDVDNDGNGYIDDLIGFNVSNFGDGPEIGDATNDLECWHGTPVTGIISARTNNNAQFAGIAGGWDEDPGASLVFCKVGPNPFDVDVFAGLTYFLNGVNVDILNISMNGDANVDITAQIDALAGNGTFISVSTGNLGQAVVQYPATLASTFAVGSSLDDARAPFSNFGEDIEITAPSSVPAPGCIVYSTGIIEVEEEEIEPDPEENPGPCEFGGTSASAAQVTGVAALLRSQEPSLTVENLFEILCLTAGKDDEDEIGYDLDWPDFLYGTWNEEMGYGELRAGEAVTFGRRQVVEIPAGWSLISSRMEPYFNEDNGMDDEHGVYLTCDEIVEDLILLKDEDGLFWSPPWEFCNMLNWDYLQGYQIDMEQAGTLIVLGCPAEPDAEIPLTMGWNYVPFFPTFSQSAPYAFEDLVNEESLLIAKDAAGNYFLPDYVPNGPFNNMPPLEEGKGYEVRVDFATVLYTASYLHAHRRCNVWFGSDHRSSCCDTVSTNSSRLGKYRLCVHMRRVSFQTRSIGFNSGL